MTLSSPSHIYTSPQKKQTVCLVAVIIPFAECFTSIQNAAVLVIHVVHTVLYADIVLDAFLSYTSWLAYAVNYYMNPILMKSILVVG